ncbi:MAG: NAD-dependent epimerase/dehydratase family protein [Sulfurimonas sp.]|jgi:nucleoside-diphosphate-sugar epimerase
MKILVTGSAGFIAGYLIEKLLAKGHYVYGIDNFAKYGRVKKKHDSHGNFTFVEGDAKNGNLIYSVLSECDHFIAAAASIGGVTYFHSFAYDLLKENELITAASFNAAIDAFRINKLKKITVVSSSMVFENASEFPTKEGHERICPPPSSTYGFQKLATEYFAQGAYEQYKLPYTIIRPFNCCGIGESRAKTDKEIMSGNIKLAMSHVVPDLCQKILKGQYPLHILGNGNQIRHYTYGGDIADGIISSIENEEATNNDFNISSSEGISVTELAKLIYYKVTGKNDLKFIHDKPFQYDVQKRIPNVEKAKRILGFEAQTSLGKALDEVIPWIADMIKIGAI